MPDRTGSLSSFPTSVDQFVIKKPIDNQKALSQQTTDSLERANHVNHMFDAMYKIESHVLGGSGGIGASVVTRYATGVTNSSTDVYGSNLKMGYSTLSITMTGNTVTVTGVVPSSFGTNPFYAKGFAMSHNFYLNSPEVSGGLYANKGWGEAGPFNEMIKFHQFFTFVRPLTGSAGRQFEVMVKNFPFHSTSEQLSSTFTDTLLNYAFDYQPLWQRSGWSGTGSNQAIAAKKTVIAGITTFFMACETPITESYGWVWPSKLDKMSDSYVEWGPITATNSYSATTGDRFTRLGPMARANGTVNNATFYCVAIGDVPNNTAGLTGDLRKFGRILKVTGANLAVAATGWATSTATHFTNGATSSSGFYWFGDVQARYRLKCESVTGSAKITIETANAPYSSWTTLYGPFYDGSSPLASGYSGFFSQATTATDAYSQQNNSLRFVEFNGSVVVSNLLSNTQITGEVQLMYMLAGPESNLTMEAG
jgi:hypothetical protein